MTNSAELLPCAHCGAPDPVVGFIRDGCEVRCRCGASMSCYAPDSRKKAIAAWNTRAESRPSLQGDVVERVARAIALSDYPAAGTAPETLWPDDFSASEQIEYRRRARAALDACGQDGRIGEWYDEATDIPPSEQEEG